jgi:hypothetical protein
MNNSLRVIFDCDDVSRTQIYLNGEDVVNKTKAIVIEKGKAVVELWGEPKFIHGEENTYKVVLSEIKVN